MTADRRHDDNATRIAHEIEARLHHGERTRSVIHDELHKLQKLDSHQGVVHHDKFGHDVHKVEQKLHKDGYLPNLHLRVDDHNQVHLEHKKGQKGHKDEKDHREHKDSKEHKEQKEHRERKNEHQVSGRGKHPDSQSHSLEVPPVHYPPTPQHRVGSGQERNTPEAAHLRTQQRATAPGGDQLQFADPYPPRRAPQLNQSGIRPLGDNVTPPQYSGQRSQPGSENFAPTQYPDPTYRPDAVPYVPPPIYRDSGNWNQGQASDQASYGPNQEISPYRGQNQDLAPYRVPTQDLAYSGPTQESIPYQDPRYRQPGPYDQSQDQRYQQPRSYDQSQDQRYQQERSYDQSLGPLDRPGTERFDSRIGRPDRGSQTVTDGTFKELRLDNRVGNHAGADALVYVRSDFDPSKPIHLAVYNHGFGSTVTSALSKNQIREMMSHAEPNTVLMLPEWQTNPGSRSGNSGTLGQQNKFAAMVQETLQKTPALQGASLSNIDRVDIIAHSAGYSPTEKEIYRNPALSNKVRSITLLDSLYDRHGFDQWLQNNIADLSAGRKQFYNFSNSSTASNSRAQANFVASLLRSRGLPTNNYVADYSGGDQVGRHGAAMAQRSIVFASTNVRHLDIPGKYIGQTMTALNQERTTSQFFA
ncbi:MAG: hypothetical protein JST44_07825 [Cyanobacteria bacterium SZAS LIN-5]|nr:hypothetical protein [Cyanobacteria bacterium SZAS LIN-5]